MKIAMSIVVAILTYATIYAACICPYRWYKILISTILAILMATLVTFNILGL